MAHKLNPAKHKKTHGWRSRNSISAPTTVPKEILQKLKTNNIVHSERFTGLYTGRYVSFRVEKKEGYGSKPGEEGRWVISVYTDKLKRLGTYDETTGIRIRPVKGPE